MGFVTKDSQEMAVGITRTQNRALRRMGDPPKGGWMVAVSPDGLPDDCIPYRGLAQSTTGLIEQQLPGGRSRGGWDRRASREVGMLTARAAALARLWIWGRWNDAFADGMTACASDPLAGNVS
jgi:hypothetical protein